MAFAPYYTSDNTLLSELHHYECGTALKASIAVSVDCYAVASNLASIPIFSIMMRYNLIEEGIMGPRAAGFVTVVAPWLISVTFYCGEGFQNIVNFAGVFTAPIANFVIP